MITIGGQGMQEAVEQDYVAKAQVVGDHKAADSSQLDLKVGEWVYVLEKDPSGWWGGHKEGDDATGWFPYNVVRCIDEPDLIPQPAPAAPPREAEVVVHQNTSSSSTGNGHYAPELTHGFESTINAPALKLDIQEPALQTRVESPTRKARWPASPMIPQGQHNLREKVSDAGPSQSSPSRELMELKDTLKKERTKHMEELTVERGRRESLEANKVQLHEVQEALKRQNLKLEKENAELRVRVHSLETAQPQHTVGNEAEQLRRLQEQVSLYSRQAEKIWHAVEKNVNPATLMMIKADVPEESVSQPTLGGPTVEVARRLFGGGGGENSPAMRTRAESAFVANAHVSDLWAKPPTVPRSAPVVSAVQSRPAVSSREGTPVKLARPFSCNDLEPEEAPAKGAVANMVRKLERCCSTPPQRILEQGISSHPPSRGRSPGNSEKVMTWQPQFEGSTKGFCLDRDVHDNDEPVNFGMSPISTARALLVQEASSSNKGNEVGAAKQNPGVGCGQSSIVKNRIRQLENGGTL